MSSATLSTETFAHGSNAGRLAAHNCRAQKNWRKQTQCHSFSAQVVVPSPLWTSFNSSLLHTLTLSAASATGLMGRTRCSSPVFTKIVDLTSSRVENEAALLIKHHCVTSLTNSLHSRKRSCDGRSLVLHDPIGYFFQKHWNHNDTQVGNLFTCGRRVHQPMTQGSDLPDCTAWDFSSALVTLAHAPEWTTMESVLQCLCDRMCVAKPTCLTASPAIGPQALPH